MFSILNFKLFPKWKICEKSTQILQEFSIRELFSRAYTIHAIMMMHISKQQLLSMENFHQNIFAIYFSQWMGVLLQCGSLSQNFCMLFETALFEDPLYFLVSFLFTFFQKDIKQYDMPKVGRFWVLGTFAFPPILYAW